MSETKMTWRRRVADWRASGRTADEFSAERGFKAPTLRWWASRLKREETRQAAPLVSLARVIRTPSQPVSEGTVVIEVLDVRARVTVETGVERATLDAVFGALGIGGAR